MPNLARGSRPNQRSATRSKRLAVPRRFLEELLGRCRVEALIAAQHREERREVAPEPRLGHRGEHLRADLRDFGEADRVDFVGRQVERRVRLDLRGIPRRAVGHRRGGERRAQAGQIGRAEEFQQVAVRGDDGVADDAHRLGAQARLRRGGDRRGHRPERFVEHRPRFGSPASAIAATPASRPVIVTAGGVKPRARPARMFAVCSAKIAWHLAHRRQPRAILALAAERPPSGRGEACPENSNRSWRGIS